GQSRRLEKYFERQFAPALALMSAGKFLLHKGGDQFLEIPGGEFGPKQISPTRDTRLCGATFSGGMSGSADVGKTRTPHRHNFAWNRYDPAGAGSRLPHRHRACPSANASTFCCVRLPCRKTVIVFDCSS